MKPQFIETEAGDELVVLTRREYDALLLGENAEAAEDRAVARLTDAYLAEEEAGRVASVPFWFVELVMTHGSPVTAARKHHGCTQIELAQVLDISQGHLSDIERGRRQLSDIQRTQIAAHTGVGADWLV